MKKSFLVRSSRALALACLSVAAFSFARAEDEAKPYTISGFADLYYQWDSGRPATVPGSVPPFELNGRQYDTRHNRYRLALAWVDIIRAATAESPLGFNLTLLAGNSADIISGLEPGGADTFKNFGQAYATYLFSGSKPITVDLGKFFTPIGYEGSDSRSQDNYSRGMNFFASQPIYHTGVRVSAPLSDKLSASAGIVNGWNEVQDSNGSKSLFLSGSYAATSKLGLTVSGYFGKEGSDSLNGIGFAKEANTSLFDIVGTYQLDDSTKLALNFDYGDAKDLGKWTGLALYGKKTLSASSTAGVRFEYVDDKDGIRTGTVARYNSLTGTYDMTVNSSLTLRFELRTDMASEEVFLADNGMKKSRTTLTFAQVFKF